MIVPIVAVGEMAMLTIAGLPAIQLVARVLSTTVKLLVVEVVGETVDKAGEHGVLQHLCWHF